MFLVPTLDSVLKNLIYFEKIGSRYHFKQRIPKNSPKKFNIRNKVRVGRTKLLRRRLIHIFLTGSGSESEKKSYRIHNTEYKPYDPDPLEKCRSVTLHPNTLLLTFFCLDLVDLLLDFASANCCLVSGVSAGPLLATGPFWVVLGASERFFLLRGAVLPPPRAMARSAFIHYVQGSEKKKKRRLKTRHLFLSSELYGVTYTWSISLNSGCGSGSRVLTKLHFTYRFASIKDVQVFIPQKRTSSTLKLEIFLVYVGVFSLPDPDLHWVHYQCGSGSGSSRTKWMRIHADTDPHHWLSG